MSRIPTLLGNESKKWLDENVDGPLLPATIDHGIGFDASVDQYKALDEMESDFKSIYAEAEVEKTNLKEAIASFQRTFAKRCKVEVDMTKFQKWKEVEEIVKDLQTKHQNDSGIKACLGRMINKIGEHGDTFNAWLGLLPDGDYSSVLCGAFKLVIGVQTPQAAIKATQIRDKIFETLERIPGILDRAKILANMHKSTRLETSFSKLYTVILQLFEEMFTWLSMPSMQKTFTTTLHLGSHEKRLQERVLKVDEYAAIVRDEASSCSQLVIRGISENLEKQGIHLRGVNFTVNGIESKVEIIQNNVGELRVMLLDLYNAIYILYKGQLNDTTASHPQQAEHRDKVSLKASRDLCQQLLVRLKYDSRLAERDAKIAAANGRGSLLHDQERTEYIIESEQFKGWFTSTSSQSILVISSTEVEKISPASFVCSIVTSALRHSKAIVASFFCGLHTDRGEKYTGARKLLASLICQMLEQHGDFDLSIFLPDQEVALRRHELKVLCDLLVTLTKQLPENQLLLIAIDGMSYYENRQWKEDFLKVMTVMTRLVEDKGIKAVVKLIVSGPVRSRDVSKIMSRGCIFEVPEDLEYTNQGFNSDFLGRQANAGGKSRRVPSHIVSSSDSSDEDSETTSESD